MFLIGNTGGLVNGVHWSLLVIDNVKKTIQSFDSFSSLSIKHLNRIKKKLTNAKVNVKDYACLIRDCSRQSNNDDCGPYCLLFAKQIINNVATLKVTAKDVEELREQCSIIA
uniref:ULP_PROTEASE domain-containing protein n=1 Tax=Rhabditophanes sp. KR3021 TaxID=114890 RepID=A0AC35TY41_9BILA